MRFKFQLILNPIRDWNSVGPDGEPEILGFQLILNPIRDWNRRPKSFYHLYIRLFQLILNPIRDWNNWYSFTMPVQANVPINLKPY